MLYLDAASLPEGLGKDIRICAKGKEKGDDFKYEVKFDADPEPDDVSSALYKGLNE